ncbi:MAG: hypothetical protein R3D59_08955 [Paracoccaceae bacterium]
MKDQITLMRLFPAALAGAVVLAVVAIHLYDDTPVASLTRDPVSVLGGSVLVGAMSQLGLFLWAAGAAAGFLGAAFARRVGDESAAILFPFLTGLLSLVLGLDDCFQFHEEIGPVFGLPQDATLGAYAIAAVAVFWVYRAFVARTDLVLLAMAAAGFGASIFLDVLEPLRHSGAGYLLEDGAKFFGIAAWSLYLGDTALRICLRQTAQTT